MKPIDYMEAAQKCSSKFNKNGGFLTTKSQDQLNTMTISWWTIGFIWQRPILMALVRPTRHTFTIIESATDFTVSIPNPDLPKVLALCGSKSGKDMDKFAAAGLKAQPSQHVYTPIISVPGIHYECKIMIRSTIDNQRMVSELELFYPNKDYHTMTFGEIVACYEL